MGFEATSTWALKACIHPIIMHNNKSFSIRTVYYSANITFRIKLIRSRLINTRSRHQITEHHATSNTRVIPTTASCPRTATHTHTITRPRLVGWKLLDSHRSGQPQNYQICARAAYCIHVRKGHLLHRKKHTIYAIYTIVRIQLFM